MNSESPVAKSSVLRLELPPLPSDHRPNVIHPHFSFRACRGPCVCPGAAVLSVHTALCHRPAVPLVSLAFISLLLPSNLGSSSLPLSSSQWLTPAHTDLSSLTSGWCRRDSSIQVFCRSRCVVVLLSPFTDLGAVWGWGRGVRENEECFKGCAALAWSKKLAGYPGAFPETLPLKVCETHPQRWLS